MVYLRTGYSEWLTEKRLDSHTAESKDVYTACMDLKVALQNGMGVYSE